MTDPRRDPQPGDVVENGVRRRVVAREGAFVAFELLDQPAEGQKRIAVLTWQRWASGGIVHRDLKPPNVLAPQRESANGVQHPAPNAETPKPESLSRRDAAALSALHQLRDGSGRVPAALSTLLEHAQLKATTWERAVASLKAKGLLQTWLDPQGHYQVRRYELTPAGRSAAESLDSAAESTGAVPESLPESSRSRLGSGSKDNGEAKKTTTTTTGGDSGGVVSESSRGVVSDATTTALLAAVSAIADAVKVVAEQTRATHALIELLAQRLGAPARSASGPVPSQEPATTRENPACKACGAPTEQRTGEHGPFLGCSRFPECRETSSIGSASSAPAKRPRPAKGDPDRAWIEALKNEPPVSNENLAAIRAKHVKRDPSPIGDAVAELTGGTGHGR